MYSIGEVAAMLGLKYNCVHRWVRQEGLGRKVGWGIVLSDSDVEKLKGKNDRQKAA